LAQFRELEAFSAFASDLDKATQAQLARGKKLVEILKQGQYLPYKVETQVVVIWAATNGYLDAVADKDVQKFERELVDFLSTKHSAILAKISSEQKIGDDTKESMKSALNEFKAIFKGN
jgi:F-type H+/Na+-transporting ATPase subunit alpha